jgi:hypothetical protein
VTDPALAADMHRKAGAIAKAAAERGTTLDFTPESLADLDELLDRLFGRRWPVGRSGRLDTRRYEPMIEPVAAYVGETLLRIAGGDWDVHPERGPGVHLADGGWEFPLETAQQRFELGHEHSLSAFGAAMARLGDE